VPGSSGCSAFANPEGFKVFEALQEWVEKGKAPDRIIYPHTKGGGMMGGGEVYRTRPVCPYPKQARYKGSDDINDASNFTCVDPNE
jgi:feruloyl esterase